MPPATMYIQTTPVRILVTSSSNGKQSRFTVRVMDGSKLVYSEDAEGIVERDKLVWKLADLFSTTHIDIQNSATDSNFRFGEIPASPALDMSDRELLVAGNPLMVSRRILQAVQEGLQTNRSEIRLFELAGTGCYLTSMKGSWAAGIELAKDIFLKKELYLQCAAARDVLKVLNPSKDET